MKIVNPNWQSAEMKAAQKHRAAVLAYMAANPNNRLVTIAEIKAALPAVAAELSREVINTIVQIENLEIEDRAAA